MSDELMTTQELAAYLRVSMSTIYNWRTEHRGPPASKIGKHLRYRRVDVDAWIAEHTKEHTA